jgi:protein SCO1
LSHRRFEGRRPAAVGASLLFAATVVLSACSAARPDPPSPGTGIVENQTIPSALLRLPLSNQHGSTVTLGSFRGKTLMVVPFLTLCNDICPMTTGNLLEVQRSLGTDGAGTKVQIVELSVDPGRDDVARLAAYAHLTGAGWELVTESPTDLARLAHFFGFYYQKVPQDDPPSIDWLTHQPLTYDIDHSDGYVLIDRRSHMRFVTGAAPDYHGTLNPTLHAFLSDLGGQHLAHPPSPGWTPTGALGALGWLMGMPLPPAA